MDISTICAYGRYPKKGINLGYHIINNQCYRLIMVNLFVIKLIREHISYDKCFRLMFDNCHPPRNCIDTICTSTYKCMDDKEFDMKSSIKFIKDSLTHRVYRPELSGFIRENAHAIRSVDLLFDNNNVIESTTKYIESDFIQTFLNPVAKEVLQTYLCKFLYQSIFFHRRRKRGEICTKDWWIHIYNHGHRRTAFT